MKSWKLFFLILVLCFSMTLVLVACGDDDDDDDDNDAESDDDAAPTEITVSGNAFGFPEYEYIAGATISILEFPERSTTTDEDGYWEFADLPVGEEASFVLEHPDYHTTQTKTFTLPAEDVTQVTFQVPDHDNYTYLAAMIPITPDPEKCQMVTTVTRVGKSIYDEGAHGEAGATVTIDPSVPAEHGPIYFDSTVLPNTSLTETSDDGGVLFVNVDPGTYTLYGHKTGVEFVSPVMTCRPDILVNASPPYGLQALE